MSEPTSFDALAHEHNLSGRLRDLCRIFFKAGIAIGRRQERQKPSEPRLYSHVLDRDTAPGEFR